MSDYDKADRDCETIQKQHGPGGELPTHYEVPVKQKTVDVPWEPVKPEKSASVKYLALRILPYSVASGVVFWWQQTEQLADTTGFWALIILALLGGFSIGRCCNG